MKLIQGSHALEDIREGRLDGAFAELRGGGRLYLEVVNPTTVPRM